MMGVTALKEQGVVMLQDEVLNIRVAKWGVGDLSSL